MSCALSEKPDEPRRVALQVFDRLERHRHIDGGQCRRRIQVAQAVLDIGMGIPLLRPADGALVNVQPDNAGCRLRQYARAVAGAAGRIRR